MRSTPPYFPFYVDDFLASPKVLLMSPAARGAYIMLLCRAWQGDPPATLPNNDADLSALSGLSLADWQSVKPAVLRCFTLRNERLLNVRLEHEYLKFAEKREKASAAGRRSGESRRNQALTTERPFNGCSTDVERSGYGYGNGSVPPTPEGESEGVPVPAEKASVVAGMVAAALKAYKLDPLMPAACRVMQTLRANCAELVLMGVTLEDVRYVVSWATHQSAQFTPKDPQSATDPAKFAKWRQMADEQSREQSSRRERR